MTLVYSLRPPTHYFVHVSGHTRCIHLKRSTLKPLKSHKHEELLAELTQLTDNHLTTWAESNRDSITLDFLTWVSDKENQSSGEEQQQLWALCSKLMTLREGFDLVSMERVSEALQEAAAAASSSSDIETRMTVTATTTLTSTKNSTSSSSQQLSKVVQQTAALGLSAEGMVLMQQQAAALEAAVGISKARSLTELIGRVKIASPIQAQNLMEADAASRILDVLLTMGSREERIAALPDAFTPAEEDLGTDTDAEMVRGKQEEGEEEELFTSPFQLLHVVDLMLKRLREGNPNGRGSSVAGLIEGREYCGLQGEELLSALLDLKEDILNILEGSSEEF